MLLQDAKKLRDEIRRVGLHCIVPLKHGPDRYFARIFTVDGPVDFRDRKGWLGYRKGYEKRKREGERAARLLTLPPPRSPLELMIDRACGLA